MKATKEINGNKIMVVFSYDESCNNVYKTFNVYINNKKSNIRGLKKYLKDIDDIPEVITAKTFFWKPGRCADMRRRNEARIILEVESWLNSEGFRVDEE